MLDIYSDYLISSFGQTTATALGQILGISHDMITRFLSENEFKSKDLWDLVKKSVRKIESEDGVLIIDDTIEEKEYTDENSLITWHYDHNKGRNVKGVNILTCLYHSKGISIPVSFELVRKTEEYLGKDGKIKKKSPVSKNEMVRRMLETARNNVLRYKYVLADKWFASSENMKMIKHKLNKDFIFPVKKNRLLALTVEDRKAEIFVSVEEINIEADTERIVYLKDLDFAVKLTKKVFKNKDETEGILYLISSDMSLTSEEIGKIYQKRWKIEEYHKSLKNNSSLKKSPTKTERTQSNHFFASIYAEFKLEVLKMKTKLNHFALKQKIYISALQTAYDMMTELTRA